MASRRPAHSKPGASLIDIVFVRLRPFLHRPMVQAAVDRPYAGSSLSFYGRLRSHSRCRASHHGPCRAGCCNFWPVVPQGSCKCRGRCAAASAQAWHRFEPSVPRLSHSNAKCHARMAAASFRRRSQGGRSGGAALAPAAPMVSLFGAEPLSKLRR
jgi:hypothetical protein